MCVGRWPWLESSWRSMIGQTVQMLFQHHLLVPEACLLSFPRGPHHLYISGCCIIYPLSQCHLPISFSVPNNLLATLTESGAILPVVIYTIILLKSVCLSVLANSRSQFLLDRLGRCLKLFASTEILSYHEFASLAILLYAKTRKTIAKTESPAPIFIWTRQVTRAAHHI